MQYKYYIHHAAWCCAYSIIRTYMRSLFTFLCAHALALSPFHILALQSTDFSILEHDRHARETKSLPTLKQSEFISDRYSIPRRDSLSSESAQAEIVVELIES